MRPISPPAYAPAAVAAPRPTWPRISYGRAAAVFGLVTLVGLLRFLYEYLEYVAVGVAADPVRPLIAELSGAWGAGLLLVPTIFWARRFPLDRPGWLARVPAHLLGAAVFAAAHTSFMWGFRAAAFPVLGLGAYDYGRMPVRYAMEAPQQLVVYAAFLTFTYLLDRYLASRERELRASQLEARLARAQLETLRTQLNPHFLFNALNTVSSVMYDDVRRADTVLSRLAELLRRTMRTSGEQQVPLAEELEVLEMYLDVMRARFGDRLQVEIAADDEARRALVPSLLLQPLVENAIRHGEPPPPRPAQIAVRASREGERVAIEVRDNGPGIRGDWRALLGRGIGLSNTVERLAHLYGDGHRIELDDAEGGGLVVRIEIPFAASAVSVQAAPGREPAWSA
jgi:two-component system, LytTR family, sensor kinase